MKWIFLFMSIGIYALYYTISEHPWNMDVDLFPFADRKMSAQAWLHYGCTYISRVFFVLSVGLFYGKRSASFVILAIFELLATGNYFGRCGESFFLPGFDTVTIRYIVYFVVCGLNIMYDQIHLNETAK